MNIDILDSFLVSIINQGMAGIREKDLNKVISTIDFIDNRIDSINAILEDPQFSMNDEVLVNNSRLRDVISNFGFIFRIYQSYLQQTSGNKPYVNWFNEVNQAAPYNGRTPSTYLNSLQPLWYVGRDDDNDGTWEQVIPEYTPSGQPLNWNSSTLPSALIYRTARGLVQGGSGSPSASGGLTAVPTTTGRRVTVGDCDPKYSFRIRQSFDPLQPTIRSFFGFAIKNAPRLEITMFAACPNTSPTPIFTTTVNSNLYYSITPNSEGNLVIQTIDSQRKSVGKITYEYYYEMQTIMKKIFDEISVIQLNNKQETIYQNIKNQLEGINSKPCFVDNYGPTMGLSAGMLRNASFYDAKTPPTGFIEGLPLPVKSYIYPLGQTPDSPKIAWYPDTVNNNEMNVIENFFLMGATDYGSITYNDVKLNTNVQSELPTSNPAITGITSVITSRLRDVVENKGSVVDVGTNQPTQTPTGGPGDEPLVLNLDEYGETIDTQNPYYGKISWKFKIAKSVDCSAPYYEESASVRGFMWEYLADFQNPKESFYPEAIRSLITETSGGEVTGQIVDVLRGDRNSPEFVRLLQNGLTPMKNSTTNLVTEIPGQSCLEGVKTDYQWGIKRQKRVPFKIFCNKPGVGRVEINYRNPGTETNKWITSYLARPNSGASTDLNGKLLTTVDGYYYTTVDEIVPVIPRVSGEPGPYFSSYSSVQRKKSATCVPQKRVVSTWRVDVDNPCGCDEVEVLTHYLVYDAVSYTDPLSGQKSEFPIQEELDPAFPAPESTSPGAAYGLTIGQELTTNRRQKVDCFEGTGIGRLHHPFLYGTDILPGLRKKSIKGLFNLSQSLECVHTSSNQNPASKDYYYEVTDCDNCSENSYFALSYGNWKGSGSVASGYEYNDSPSRAIYSQYRLLTLDPNEKYFTFYDSGSLKTPDDIYVINFYRNGLSDKLDIGNFEINLAELSGSGVPNNVHTGSKVRVSGSTPNILSLIDNSAIFEGEDVCANDDPNYYYDIVSGSLSSGIHSSGTGSLQQNPVLTTYGKVYPNLGVIVLDGSKLNVSASFNSVSGSSVAGDNSWKLFTAISGAAVVGKPMRARNVKFKTTNHYFVRIPSGEANYSNNPTYTIDSGIEKGKIKNTCFVDNPMSYITTIGLYNTKKELIAVAKLSKPIKKSRENDVLIKIRLNW
jgi:hypothetical protein